MSGLLRKIDFELHITVNLQEFFNINNFTKICSNIGGKPLFIELANGETPQQLMMSKLVSENSFEQVLEFCKNVCKEFLLKGFVTNRIKIEINSNLADLFEENPNNYFEWHGKVELKFHEKLLEICKKHNAHLSKNSLKDENNLRFITLREFGKKPTFENRVVSLIKDLKKNDFELIKQQSEFCVFDNNISLDKGWLEI